MELIPVEVELEPAGAVDPTEFMWGDGAEGTEGFPEEVRETELLTLDTGTLLLFILLETWSTEFTMGLESGKTETYPNETSETALGAGYTKISNKMGTSYGYVIHKTKQHYTDTVTLHIKNGEQDS